MVSASPARAGAPLSTLDSGSKALAFMFRIDPDYGHSGTIQCQIKNTYYNGASITWQNGGFGALHWNTALPGTSAPGMGGTDHGPSGVPGQRLDDRAPCLVQIAVSPATYAVPEANGLPPAVCRRGWWHRYSADRDGPAAARDRVGHPPRHVYHLDDECRHPLADGRFCVKL